MKRDSMIIRANADIRFLQKELSNYETKYGTVTSGYADARIAKSDCSDCSGTCKGSVSCICGGSCSGTCVGGAK